MPEQVVHSYGHCFYSDSKADALRDFVEIDFMLALIDSLPKDLPEKL